MDCSVDDWLINTGVKLKKGFPEVGCALFRGANCYAETIYNILITYSLHLEIECVIVISKICIRIQCILYNDYVSI